MAMVQVRNAGGTRGGGRRVSPYFAILVLVICIEILRYAVFDDGFPDHYVPIFDLPTTTSDVNNDLRAIHTVAEERIRQLEKRLDESLRLLDSQKKIIEELHKVVVDDHNPNPKETSKTGATTATSDLVKRMENMEHTLAHELGIAGNLANSNIIKLKKRMDHMGSKQGQDDSRNDALSLEIVQLKQDIYEEKFRQMEQEKIKIQEIFRDQDNKAYLNPLKNYNATFCVPWAVSTDDWWTHHVDWFVSTEDDNKYCFSPMKSGMKKRTFQYLYNIQFRGDCSQVLTKRMWSSGWGADFANIVDGLIYAMETKRPFQVTKHNWHYAAKRDGSRPVCPEKTMNCYFLPLSRCDHGKQFFNDSFYYVYQPMFRVLENRFYMEYATRPQTWLRKEIYDFSKGINLTSPCTVMHVRRSDVVLHKNWARRYYALEEYMNATDNITNTIFLVSDDDNAIKEAHTKFPDHNWVVIDRPRFKGKEGGWENHIPSDDPKLEVIVLMSIFRKVGMCRTLIHTRSNLADYIAGVMMSVRHRDFLRVDMNKDRTKIYSPKHEESHNISKAEWG